MSKSRSSDPTATRAHEQDSPLPVYFAWFTGNAPEAIFVEKDCIESSGRLMSPLSFLNDALVGTRYELSSAEALEKMPTFVRKELIGYVEPESLSFLKAVCRTVLSLGRSPFWARLALVEIEFLSNIQRG